MTFHIFVNYLKMFNGLSLVLIKIVENSKPDDPVIYQTLADI